MHSAPALRPTVLVVEDEANIRELVCLHLGLEEVASEQAANGNAGLDLARSKKFDLVILDNLMPRKSGLDWLAALRVGVVDFVLKPFRSNQLLNAVARCLDRTRLQRENDVLRHELRSQSGPFADLSG